MSLGMSFPGRRKPSLGLPAEQSTLHLGAQQVIMGQLVCNEERLQLHRRRLTLELRNR
jgi:prophage tail gpP-like protein